MRRGERGSTWTIVASCALFACSSGSDGGGGAASGAYASDAGADAPATDRPTDAGANDAAPAAGELVTYYSLDRSSTCADGIVTELAFDPKTLAGTRTPRACAPAGEPAGPIDPGSVVFHQRFKNYLVSAGDVFVAATEHSAQLTPVMYCRKADTETKIEMLAFALSVSVDGESCDLQRSYRDPVDSYYTEGGGQSSCTSRSYVRTPTQLSFDYAGNLAATVSLDSGDALGGYPGTARLTLKNSTGAELALDVRCWVAP